MDAKKIIDDTTKWFKNPKTVKYLSMYLVVIILMALNFSYWAGAISVGKIGGGGYADIDIPDSDGETELVKEIVLDQTGSAARGAPSGASSTKVPFTVGEGGKILIVNLTCTNPWARTDYDLVVYGPDGKNVGQSAGADADEQVVVDYSKNANKTLPAGTYEAEIVFFLMTTGTTWHLEVTVWYEVECTDEGCAIE